MNEHDTEPAPPQEDDFLPLESDWTSPLEGQDLGLPNPGHEVRNPP